MDPKIARVIQKEPDIIEAYGEDNQLMFSLKGYLHSYTYNTVLVKPKTDSEIAYVYDFEGGLRGQRSV
ncbi:MAG: hypothetical protein KIG68_06515 [Oxalobacter sp.]|nr:hypothetical protein [Oxalobacter sp.]